MNYQKMTAGRIRMLTDIYADGKIGVDSQQIKIQRGKKKWQEEDHLGT